MRPLKALVVDDSAFSRQTIKNMLENCPGVEVLDIATNGIDAIAKTLRLKPDLITLDLEMPEMDGFSFLRWIMIQKPTPVIVVSAQSDSRTVFEALELGAADFIGKPSKKASAELKNIEKSLIEKVNAIRGLNIEVLSRNLRLLAPAPEPQVEAVPRGPVDIAAIGSSTGGPAALQIILTKLPDNFPAALVISQHMPRGFTGPLAERLDKLAKIGISEARDGDEVEPARAYICPGGAHMTLKKRGTSVRISLKQAAPEDRYVPSVDVMMKSVAEVYGERSLGVLLTGMGNDGKEGMLEIKHRGGYTIAESQETAIVFGMPREAIKAGAAAKVLPLTEVSGELIRVTKYGA
ncbi:MAG: chemotaxis response regulator protein-glutamate methylesterase [Nitrospiraceae bacterium]|nr:chemotaxis response regulator protein-glutamate methylesterase [Nitrospiraceae bacterium]